MKQEINKNHLIKELIQAGILCVAQSPKTSEWIPLKNGSKTPIFLDTSKFISFPKILDELNEYIIQIISEHNIKHDKILGLPYGGLPFSYGVASKLGVPSLAIRKEGFKNYSTKGELLGHFKDGETVLCIEDAIVTAKTAIDFVEKVHKYGLRVKDLITVLDVGVGGDKNLEKIDVRSIAVFTWLELAEAYILIKKPRDEVKQMLLNFLGISTNTTN